MIFPAIGLTTAVWLLMAPLLGLESGVRAGLGIAVGVAVAVLMPLGFLYRRANVATAALGIFMGFANFFMPGTTLAYASFATCSVLLIYAGLPAWPVVDGVRVVLAAPVPVVARDTQTTGDTWMLASPPDLHVSVDEDLHLAPRKRGEVAGRRPAGEGQRRCKQARTLSLPTLSPLRGARANSFSVSDRSNRTAAPARRHFGVSRTSTGPGCQ